MPSMPSRGWGWNCCCSVWWKPVLFGGTTSGDYSDTQRILHWLLTILCWGAMIALLTHFSKRKLQFDPLARRPFSKKGLGAAAVLAAVCVLLNALDWGTLKIVGEWQSKGALLFFFQYVYYLFEIGLGLFDRRLWPAVLLRGCCEKRAGFPSAGWCSALPGESSICSAKGTSPPALA